ncbi:SRPBCC family protein [Actinoalloteichus hymeniacidonis]|jgi:hypothetical protein|uniref:Polyketide cyclase / dehydrase and lipid transport n=1 Tax=Actinoalloteichus hymeniacidonis TaxID=340345 RepID=A0AAC9MW20_9PSEU|nr:SRPBCC family protein [Actinoalloteichus hymeniacidonis]AOS61738.1 Polyketide cyclase / dehydrase and lipid transport [Actinoalloteichus hymeniacidonis]MBB5910244.1 hypothetical protein [Actinoalloteichus hymeniacidonis]
MTGGTVRLQEPVPAPISTVWAAATDWARQGEWMLGTEVDVVEGDGRGVGSRLAAFSAIGGIGILDRMEITAWNPPRSVEVRHTGKVVRGVGGFRILPDPVTEDHSIFLWYESFSLPLGILGEIGWVAARPAVEWGLRKSLRDFARFCRDYPD